MHARLAATAKLPPAPHPMTVEDLVDSVDGLLSLPDAAIRLNALLVETHRNHARSRTLTAAELERLGLVKNGLLMKEIACMLGVSESAIKQRLKNARVKLNVKTGSQAAARATMLGMI